MPVMSELLDRAADAVQAATTPAFGNFVGGEWRPSHTRPDLRKPQPGRHARSDRHVRGLGRGRRGDGHPGGRDRVPRLARDPGAQARRDPLSLRSPDVGAQGATRQGDDPRDGQGPGRGPGRCPGGHRHRLPDGRRGPPHVRRYGAIGAARQVGHEHPPADRRGRHHHALELPHGHPLLEDDAGPRDRQHRRHQAGLRHAALRRPARRAHARGGLSAGHRQPRDRLRRRGRRAHRREPRRGRHQLHRQRRDRHADRRTGGASASSA